MYGTLSEVLFHRGLRDLARYAQLHRRSSAILQNCFHKACNENPTLTLSEAGQSCHIAIKENESGARSISWVEQSKTSEC